MRMEARLDACDAKPMRTLSSYGSRRSRLCENARGPRMRRIVFSFAFFRHGLTVQLVSISTKSRLRFYTQVSCRTFHTAWFAGTTQDDCQLSNSRRTFTTSPRHAPEPLRNLPPKEGVGNAGCPWHPQPRVHLVVVERTRVTTSRRLRRGWNSESGRLDLPLS